MDRPFEITDERITKWREYIGDYEHSDEEVRTALVIARKWVGSRRYSDSIVAWNVLNDGYPHA